MGEPGDGRASDHDSGGSCCTDYPWDIRVSVESEFQDFADGTRPKGTRPADPKQHSNAQVALREGVHDQKERERYMRLAVFVPLLLVGCRSLPSVGGVTNPMKAITGSAESEPLTVLSVTGGLCLMAGMVLLVITRGTKGWYPSIGGVILVLLNYMVAKYDDWIFIPVVILTGMVSSAWAYRTVVQILSEKKTK